MKQMTAEIKLKQYFETTDMNYSKNSLHSQTYIKFSIHAFKFP